LTRVLATGTFDILHPGHIFYLEESAKLGDELWVIVARDGNVRHKPKPILPETQRLMMVSALKAVDHAVLGDEVDMWRPIREIRPDIITLGFNQHFSEENLITGLSEQGLTSEIKRIAEYSSAPYSGSRIIVARIRELPNNLMDMG